jgi:C4-dicarboxylate-specific signal transduction histidine kinase
MKQAAEQARRAADVVGRLRRVIERPDRQAELRPVALQEALRSALHLLAPEMARRAVTPSIRRPDTGPVCGAGRPVALEQIVHNLLMNALQALDRCRPANAACACRSASTPGAACSRVSDNGAGLSPKPCRALRAVLQHPRGRARARTEPVRYAGERHGRRARSGPCRAARRPFHAAAAARGASAQEMQR